jgi:hypothetical protein
MVVGCGGAGVGAIGAKRKKKGLTPFSFGRRKCKEKGLTPFGAGDGVMGENARRKV